MMMPNKTASMWYFMLINVGVNQEALKRVFFATAILQGRNKQVSK
jgi:hypothetical protein